MALYGETLLPCEHHGFRNMNSVVSLALDLRVELNNLQSKAKVMDVEFDGLKKQLRLVADTKQ